MYELIPRFHYTFRFRDLFFSFIPGNANKSNLREIVGESQPYFLNSARAGIFLLLKSLSQEKPLRVGIQPFTCPTVFHSILEAGCTPVFIEITSNLTIDTKHLEAKKENIDLLIVTHTFGIPANMESIREIMSGKWVIEDCAHAFLSVYNSKPCGTWGDASVFSINYGKFPSIGSGGFVVINNNKIKNEFEHYYNTLPNPDFSTSIIQPFKNLFFSIAFKPFIYGLITYPLFKSMDKRFDFIGKNDFNPQKGIAGNRKVLFKNLERYAKINRIRREKSLQLIAILPLSCLHVNVDGSNCYQIPIFRKDRDLVFQELLKAGYEAGKHFSRSIDWAVKYGYVVGSCPVAEKMANEILTLPNTYLLNVTDMKKIVSILNPQLA